MRKTVQTVLYYGTLQVCCMAGLAFGVGHVYYGLPPCTAAQEAAIQQWERSGAGLEKGPAKIPACLSRAEAKESWSEAIQADVPPQSKAIFWTVTLVLFAAVAGLLAWALSGCIAVCRFVFREIVSRRDRRGGLLDA